MFAARYYNGRAFALRYFPKVGAAAPVSAPGRLTIALAAPRVSVAVTAPSLSVAVAAPSVAITIEPLL